MQKEIANSTILITGGTGFLGSHLLFKLSQLNTKLITLVRATSKFNRIQYFKDQMIHCNSDDNSLEEIFKHNPPDFIIHCATNYNSDLLNCTDVIDANFTLPLKLLQLSAKYNKSTFVNIDTTLHRDVNIYALAKKQFSEWLTLFSAKTPCINISLTHFYGAFDNHSKFCTQIINSLLNEVEKIDLTYGQQKRDFIHITDVVNAIFLILKQPVHNKPGLYPYEVGTGKNTTIEDFVTLVKTLTQNQKTHLNFGALEYREHEVMEYNINLTELSLLGWEPRYNLAEGIAKTIKDEINKNTGIG